MAYHTWLPSPAPPSFCPGLQKGLHSLVLAFAVFSKLHEGPGPEPLFLCCDWLPTDDEMGRGSCPVRLLVTGTEVNTTDWHRACLSAFLKSSAAGGHVTICLPFQADGSP